MTNSAQLQTAISLHRSGKIEEAASIYEEIINDNPSDVNALRLLGIIAASKGELDHAKTLVETAISFQADFAQGYGTLGLILARNDDIDNSVQACNRALQLNPNLVDANLGLALAQQKKGSIDRAIISLEKVISVDPNHIHAIASLADLLLQKGNIDGAIKCYRRICSLQPNASLPFIKLAETVQNVQFREVNPGLKADLLKCFDVENLSHNHLAVPCASVIKSDEGFQRLIEIALSRENLPPSFFSEGNLSTLCDPLFLKLLQKCTIPDRELELLLTRIRSSLLYLSLSNSKELTRCSPNFKRFIYALSTECFFNEYLYAETEDETEKVILLERAINVIPIEKTNSKEVLSAIFGCFRPMHNLHDAEKIRDSCDDQTDPDFFRCIEDQITNPLTEQEIRRRITSLVEDKDQITELVQAQYQANPFPRWKNCSIRRPGNMKDEIARSLPSVEFSDNLDYERPEILIAGCGTGLQAINCSYTYKDAQITAIDLSLTSLSYAIRKTEELGIKNIRYLHANILELELIGKKFDLIECFGVLHHLSKPIEGWRVLTQLLKNEGFMMLGLYSETARDSVVAARELIAKKEYPSTIEGIRQCRRDIFEMKNNELIGRITSPRASFWTASEVRDLIFHEMEYRYTIPEIADTISLLGLQFLGFQHHSPATHAKYVNSFPDDPDALNLDNWHDYERANPRTFSNTYKFWLKKHKDLAER